MGVAQVSHGPRRRILDIILFVLLFQDVSERQLHNKSLLSACCFPCLPASAVSLATAANCRIALVRHRAHHPKASIRSHRSACALWSCSAGVVLVAEGCCYLDLERAAFVTCKIWDMGEACYTPYCALVLFEL